MLLFVINRYLSNCFVIDDAILQIFHKILALSPLELSPSLSQRILQSRVMFVLQLPGEVFALNSEQSLFEYASGNRILKINTFPVVFQDGSV